LTKVQTKQRRKEEVELVRKCQDAEASDDKNSDGASVDRAVAHALEDDTGSADGADDGGETGFRDDDIGGTSDCNTDVGARQSEGIVVAVIKHGAEMSEALETKLPVSERFSPSQIKAYRLMISYLCFGKTPAKPSASTIISSSAACFPPGAGLSLRTLAG
jgi:hypothetical protein